MKVLHGKRSRHVLRIGVVAALLAVVAMTSVFSNLNSKQDFAGLEIDMDNYLGVIAAPTTPDGFLVENTYPYLEQPDGTYFWSGSYITFNQRYPTSTIVFDLEDVALEEIEVEGLGKCLYVQSKHEEDHASLMWLQGPYRFHISVSNLPKEELIKIAQSTKLQQN